MSKSNNDALYILIQTMTKSEKRYFKLHSNRLQSGSDKKFVQLFDILNTSGSYDDNKIIRKLGMENAIQIPNLKAHLYKQLLQSLTLFHTANSIDFEIRSLINYAQFLYNKGLYEQAEKMLDKARKSAVESDRSLLLLEITELEKNIIQHSISAKNDSRVDKIIAETRSVAASIQNINIFSNLLMRLYSFYVKKGFIRNNQDYKQIRELFLSSLPDYDEQKLSFQEKLYLYYSYVSYYFFIQDFETGYTYAKKYIALFKEDPNMILNKTEYYLKGLNNLLVAINKLHLLDEFEAVYKLLMKFHKIKGLQITENLQIMLFKYKYMHKINHYFMMGDFTGGTKIISVAESELERFALRMDKHDVLIFSYKVACLYFGAGNFRKAVVWLNKIINSKDVELREDILAFSRILNLICHYELGNTELIESNLLATYRFLLRKKMQYKYFDYILEFIKNQNNYAPGQSLNLLFNDLKSKLVPLESMKYENRPFIYFDIISWLESRTTGKSVQEIIKNKLNVQ